MPRIPEEGEYLTKSEATAIVDATLAHVEGQNDAVEQAYLTGHRKRLIETLALTPKAARPDASFLDVGCYGYFGFWAIRHLGYAHAAGIEMPLPSGETRKAREVTIGAESVTIDVHHFNLTQDEWPLDGHFDTAICLEVLEHIDHDPSGVLSRLRDRLRPDGFLVFSVPNAVSYKTLAEFLSGMPPWTYWFYNPDLSHEPRHSLEYTPFLGVLVLEAAGFEPLSLKTINAYKTDSSVAELYDLGARLGRPAELFGETMISVARKRDEQDVIRKPDALYSGEGYYVSTWPLIDPIFQNAIRRALAYTTPVEEANARSKELEEALEAEKQSVAEMSYLLDAYARRLVEMADDPTRQESGGPGSRKGALSDRRALALYRMMAPSGLKKLAEKGKLPKETSWLRHLRRHPLRVSEWRAIKRFTRRNKQGRNPQLLRSLFGQPASRSTESGATMAQERSSGAANDPVSGHATKSTTGPPAPAMLRDLPPDAIEHRMEIPEYVAKNAASYQVDLYQSFHNRVNVEGCRVLEVGSDYHLATARLFAANGASRVVASNIGDWRSPEPLPPEVEFVVGDVADTGGSLGQFDVIYGIAVLEHLPDVERVAGALRPLLAPGGIAFLQGEPIWGGNVGHHVWYDPEDGADPVRFAAGGSKTARSMRYAFSNRDSNPIPDWAHLVLSSDEMNALLVGSGVPESHAAGIVDYVYNLSGEHVGSCSNFQTASQIIQGFERHFDVWPERNQYGVPPNEFYGRALQTHSEDDLQTLGLRLWMRARSTD